MSAPVKWHEHPEHHWKWTKMELDWIAARDAQWQARLDAAVVEEREACAVAAWSHYMDTCKSGNIAPAAFVHWCCASAIRARTA